MGKWDELADDARLEKAVAALKSNGMDAVIVESGEQAKEKVMEIIPEGSEVMTMTSVTLDVTGIADEINKSGRFVSVRNKLMSMDREKQGREMQKLGAAPEYAIGSVHALTEDGKLIIASATGSQLPAYAYGSSKVVWVVGAQKVVKDAGEGMRRIEEHVFPLEDARAKKAYGMGSGVNKILTVSKEFSPGRIKVIIVKEKLGF